MQKTTILSFVGLLAVYLIGAWAIPVMDIDAAQYASIGREMAQNNNFLQVQHRGIDYYLDKPPLLFWLSALMFKLLGFSHFVYRILPILSTLLGIYAVYRFSKLYYSHHTSLAAALIMGSCQAFFLMNHDVRTDTLLTNAVMLAIWQLAEFRKIGGWRFLVGGFFWIGIAMLAKGPIGLIVPGAALFIDIVLKRDWKNIFRWEWLLGILVTGLVLLPYCVGLYQQYGSEGIYFFFWKQSFGRITGENSWDNNAPLWFQAQNFLWSFLPWVLVFIAALFSSFKLLIKQKFLLSNSQEAMSLGGFLLPFLALSTSHYQLPHYTFVVFPLAAVLTARFLNELVAQPETKSFLWTKYALMFTATVMGLIVLLLSVWAFPLTQFLILLPAIALLIFVVFLFLEKQPAFSQLVLAPFWAALACNFVMNSHIYPTLLTYQTGSVLGMELAQKPDFPLQNFYMLDLDPRGDYFLFPHALDFYTARNTPIFTDTQEISEVKSTKDSVWVYTDQKGLTALKTTPYRIETIKTYQKYHVTLLTLPFLNPELRNTRTREVFLLKVY
ncbi:ArnT family glycosyltransferase [Arundinibacter roseus]|uniref:Glycosyltransferase family 39 protein n=1 Tax=Arundinibacter roseus TaxID=2070510 RepID=A0A4R4KGB5_9BACT|nr:glycosyltransferase family 39 protein [Arundinibacter roseus]TDB67028.1 glycosyltransferase family 39 protein [Arundinibacter roseus]